MILLRIYIINEEPKYKKVPNILLLFGYEITRYSQEKN
jgi:hypothetical protein